MVKDCVCFTSPVLSLTVIWGAKSPSTNGVPVIWPTLSFDFKPITTSVTYALTPDSPQLPALRCRSPCRSRPPRPGQSRLRNVGHDVSGLLDADITNGVLTEALSKIAIPDGADHVDQNFTVTATFKDGTELATASQAYTVRVTKQIAGSKYWRVVAVSAFATPTGTPAISRLNLLDASLVGARSMTSKVVQIGAAIGSAGNYGATVGQPISAVQFNEPVDIRTLYIGHAQNSSTSGKLSSVRVENSDDGSTWKAVGTFSLTSGGTGTFQFTW